MKRLIIKDDEDGKDIITIPRARLIQIRDNHVMSAVEIRKSHEFGGVSFYLSEEYDWVLGKDSNSITVLVPLKK